MVVNEISTLGRRKISTFMYYRLELMASEVVTFCAIVPCMAKHLSIYFLKRARIQKHLNVKGFHHPEREF